MSNSSTGPPTPVSIFTSPRSPTPSSASSAPVSPTFSLAPSLDSNASYTDLDAIVSRNEVYYFVRGQVSRPPVKVVRIVRRPKEATDKGPQGDDLLRSPILPTSSSEGGDVKINKRDPDAPPKTPPDAIEAWPGPGFVSKVPPLEEVQLKLSDSFLDNLHAPLILDVPPGKRRNRKGALESPKTASVASSASTPPQAQFSPGPVRGAGGFEAGATLEQYSKEMESKNVVLPGLEAVLLNPLEVRSSTPPARPKNSPSSEIPEGVDREGFYWEFSTHASAVSPVSSVGDDQKTAPNYYQFHQPGQATSAEVEFIKGIINNGAKSVETNTDGTVAPGEMETVLSGLVQTAVKAKTRRQEYGPVHLAADAFTAPRPAPPPPSRPSKTSTALTAPHWHPRGSSLVGGPYSKPGPDSATPIGLGIYNIGQDFGDVKAQSSSIRQQASSEWEHSHPSMMAPIATAEPVQPFHNHGVAHQRPFPNMSSPDLMSNRDIPDHHRGWTSTNAQAGPGDWDSKLRGTRPLPQMPGPHAHHPLPPVPIQRPAASGKSSKLSLFQKFSQDVPVWTGKGTKDRWYRSQRPSWTSFFK